MATTADPALEGLDDYMSMIITESTNSGEKETYTQLRTRKQREVHRSFPPRGQPEIINHQRRPK